MTRSHHAGPELTQTSLRAVPRAPDVEAAAREARLKNGGAVAWVRAVVATGTLVPHAASGAWSAGPRQLSLLVHVAVALVAVGVIVLLNARRRPSLVLALAAALDVLWLAGGSWLLTEPGVVQEGAIAAAALMVALTELFVLAAAMTLPLPAAVGVGAACVATQLVASGRAGVQLRDLVAVGVTLAAFAGVAAWAGARMVRLASRTAADQHTAWIARRRVEEALAAQAEAAAQRDALLDARDVSEELSAAIVHDLKNPLATHPPVRRPRRGPAPGGGRRPPGARGSPAGRRRGAAARQARSATSCSCTGSSGAA